MRLLDYFRRQQKDPSAETAKQRLQVLMTLERSGTAVPDFLPLLQRELLEVVRKYVEIDQKNLKVDIERHDGFSMLEVNVELPNGAVSKAA
ncbi:MAG: cell division topological specificity factor MinE [Pseudomonadota bacterium]